MADNPNRREFLATLAAGGAALAAGEAFGQEGKIPSTTAKAPLPEPKGRFAKVTDLVYMEGWPASVEDNTPEQARLAKAQVVIVDSTGTDETKWNKEFLEYATKAGRIRADRIDVDVSKPDAAIAQIDAAKEQGFNGVYLVGAPDGKDAKKTDAFISVAQAAKDKGMAVIVNRGYEIADKVATVADAVVATGGYGDKALQGYTAAGIRKVKEKAVPVLAVEKADAAKGPEVKAFYERQGVPSYITPDLQTVAVDQPKAPAVNSPQQ